MTTDKTPQLTTWVKAQKPFSKAVLRASQKHAESVYPHESVGIVVDRQYVPLENNHADPVNHFSIHPDILVEYADRIQAVIHSHPLENHPAYPSRADQITQAEWQIPFGIQLINKEGAGNIIWYGDQLKTPELEGRPYIFGVYDCYSIWRDYYRIHLGIELPNIHRNENFYLQGENLYMDNAKDFGFYQVDVADMQPNDIVLVRIRSADIPNHGILYLGGDRGLHHMPYRASAMESISRYIKPNRHMFDSVWRHKDNT